MCVCVCYVLGGKEGGVLVYYVGQGPLGEKKKRKTWCLLCGPYTLFLGRLGVARCGLISWHEVLKREQTEALHAVCMEKRDCLCVLSTGIGKYLIFQLDPFTLD